VTYEVILIDNGSSVGNISEVIKEYDFVRLIQNKSNAGFSKANNQGFEIAKGEYYLVLNNDTVFIEDKLKDLIDFSVSHDDKVFIGCKLLNEDRSHQISIVDFDSISNLFGENYFLYKLFPNNRRFNKYFMNQYCEGTPIEVDVVKGAFILGHSKIFEELKGFDERYFFYAEETELCYRLKKSGGKIFYYPEFSIIHIGGATTDLNWWFKFKNQSVAKIQFFQKHFSPSKRAVALFIHYTGLLVRVPIYFLMGTISMHKGWIKKSYYYLKTIFIYPKNLFRN
jgi:GT2 family glycosyltransferase